MADASRQLPPSTSARKIKILLVSPRTPDTFWSFRHALPFVRKKAGSPPLGLLTIAASLPASWDLRLVDLDVTGLSDSQIQWADYVMVSAMRIHLESVNEIARRCHALKRPVIGGGPLFTTGGDACSEIPHVVLGEAEDLMSELVRDIQAGEVREVYEAVNRPDLTEAPTPRWDLINLQDYASMSVQFSRGCPFDCEFCDISVLNGRRPRTKSPAQVIQEFEALRRAGWNGPVFLVDDNFLGNKHRVKELLQEVISWRRANRTRISFFTEASVNLADEPELLGLMVEAGFKKVFVGIETPDPETLKECNKFQNARRDLLASVRAIQAGGLEVMGGFIIGFDGDKGDVFERQFDFIQKAGVVSAMVGLLNALPRTKLYQRLLAEGRILAESCGNNTEPMFNFITKLNGQQLIAGYRTLMKRLYEPKTYYQRARVLLKNWKPQGPRAHIGIREVRAFLESMWHLGVMKPGRREYWRFITYAIFRHPKALALAVTTAIYGHHFRTVAQSL